MVSERGDPRPDSPDSEPAATREEALAWLRTIRAELSTIQHEPPPGRPRPAPTRFPRASPRARLARLAGEADPDPADSGP